MQGLITWSATGKKEQQHWRAPLLNTNHAHRDIGITPNSDRELQPYQRYEGHTGCVEVGKQAVTNQVHRTRYSRISDWMYLSCRMWVGIQPMILYLHLLLMIWSWWCKGIRQWKTKGVEPSCRHWCIILAGIVVILSNQCRECKPIKARSILWLFTPIRSGCWLRVVQTRYDIRSWWCDFRPVFLMLQ